MRHVFFVAALLHDLRMKKPGHGAFFGLGFSARGNSIERRFLHEFGLSDVKCVLTAQSSLDE